MAQAGAYGLRIWQERIPVVLEVAKACQMVGIDPFTSISEGTLLAIVSQPDTQNLLDIWRNQGITCAQIGEVVPEEQGLTVYSDQSQSFPLRHPKVDPFWGAFEALLHSGEK